MSKMAEELYELCLQVAASRHYEADANEIQDTVLDGYSMIFEQRQNWMLHHHEADGISFWFTFAPDYSGILHADDMLSLMELIGQLEEIYIG